VCAAALEGDAAALSFPPATGASIGTQRHRDRGGDPRPRPRVTGLRPRPRGTGPLVEEDLCGEDEVRAALHSREEDAVSSLLFLEQRNLSTGSNCCRSGFQFYVFFLKSCFLSHGPTKLMPIPSIFHVSVNQMNQMYPVARNLLEILHEGSIYEIGRLCYED
jgi:hypothetical protein